MRLSQNQSLFLYLILFLSSNLSHIIQATSILASAPRINVVEGQESAVDKEQEEISSINGQVTFGRERTSTLRLRRQTRGTTGFKTHAVALDIPSGVTDVDIDLPDGVKRRFKKQDIVNEINHTIATTSSVSSDTNYWIGEDASDGSTFGFIRTVDGSIHGSLVDLSDATISQFRVDSDGSPYVVVTPSSEFPDEYDPDEDDMDISDHDDQSSPIHPTTTGQDIDDYDSTINADYKHSSYVSSPQNRYPLQQDGDYDDSGKNLDILVVWTMNAECKQSDLEHGCILTSRTEANMRALVDLAVAETNAAFKSSGIETELLLVHAYRHPTYIEVETKPDLRATFQVAKRSLQSNGDGVMDDVHELREQYGADIVAMIIDGWRTACGLSRMGPRKEWMFSVTDYSCATAYYSLAHEIGHNLGLSHDRGTKNECSSKTYNYGYRDPNAEFRTIMAYDCVSGQCDNNRGKKCLAIQKFSNPNQTFRGKPIGIPGKADSVRKINEVKAEVAKYFPHKRQTPECEWNESLLEVIIKTDDNPQQISWILSQNNEVVHSFSSYTQSNTDVNYQRCVKAGSCYLFTINDRGGDGIKNGGFIKIAEAGKTVLEVTNFNTPNSSSDKYMIPVEGTINVDVGFSDDTKKSCRWLSQQDSSKREQECLNEYIESVCVDVCNTCEALKQLKCKWDESLVEVIVKTDNNPQQISWILSQNNEVVDSISNYTQPNAVVKHQKCIKAGSCYEFTIKDTAGDGTKNRGFVKITETGETVLDYTDVISSSEKYMIPVEGTIRHKIGWPGQSKLQCKWLKTQSLWKQKQECSKFYIKGVCPNVCGTCIL